MGEIDDGGEARCDDNSLDLWSVLLHSFKDLGSAFDRRVQEIALIVLDMCNKRGGCVDNTVYALDSLVKGARTGDIWNDGEGQATFVAV